MKIKQNIYGLLFLLMVGYADFAVGGGVSFWCAVSCKGCVDSAKKEMNKKIKQLESESAEEINRLSAIIAELTSARKNEIERAIKVMDMYQAD